MRERTPVVSPRAPVSPRPPATDWLRVATYEVALLGIGTAWYWMEKDFNVADWDYPPLSERLHLTEARFDNNAFTTNHLGHAIAGAGYYGMARVADASVPVAVAAGVVSTSVWELGLEWRERVSLNDLVMTPVAGVAIGELLHQLGDYVNSAPVSRWPHRLAGYTLGLPRAFDELTRGDEIERDSRVDSLGYSVAWWHRFRLGWQLASVASGGREAVLHGLSAHAELVAIPGFLAPGRRALAFADGNRTAVDLDLLLGDRGLADVDLHVEADLCGYYAQSLGGTTDRAEGHAAMAAVNVAFRYHDRALSAVHDQLAIAHVIGPSGTVWLVDGPLSVRLGADAHVDFVAVESLAFPSWTAQNGPDGVKTVLAQHGYYYGFGFSSRFRAVAELSGVAFGAALSLGRWSSIDGRDRFQEEVTRDVPLSDYALEWEVSLRMSAPGSPLELGSAIEGRRRASWMEDVTVNRRDWTTRVEVGLRF